MQQSGRLRRHPGAGWRTSLKASRATQVGASGWTLRRSLNFLQSPRMAAALAPSDVDFKRMKDKDEVVTVFLVLPATRLTRYGRWLRLMISMMIAALLDQRKPPHPVLFLIDEASALGNLSMLSDGIALFRGYHLKIWTYWQSLDQMQGDIPGQVADLSRQFRQAGVRGQR